VFSSLRAAKINTAHETKIFNEQIKLMTTSLNAVSLAMVAITFVQPVVNNFNFDLKSGLLLVFGLLIHIQAYSLLGCLRPEPP